MKPSKKSRLEKAGFRVGNAAELLDLSVEEAALVSMRLALAGAVRERRANLGYSQSELARRLSSSQSRVAKIEAGDRMCPSTSWFAPCWQRVRSHVK